MKNLWRVVLMVIALVTTTAQAQTGWSGVEAEKTVWGQVSQDDGQPHQFSNDGGEGGGGTSACPDNVYVEYRDENFLERSSCVVIAGGGGGVISAAVCLASAGWGCGLALGTTAEATLACTEIFAARQVPYMVTDHREYDPIYRTCRFHCRNSFRMQ